jgi:Legume lectin domain/Chitobiase/beta-hexosaminidase C-terminal domain
MCLQSLVAATRSSGRALALVRAGREFSSRFLLSVAALLLVALGSSAQTNVLTSNYNNSRTGLNASETILTPANVNSTQFGKLFSQPVDGQLYAQPLYVANVTINGVAHNVVIVATENDSVYAFDADAAGGALWKASLVDTAHGAAAGASALNSSTDTGCSDLQPKIGITSTPVIDPASNTIYVEAKSKENGGFVHRLHALDLLSGAEKAPGPKIITATVPGTGDGSSAGALPFDNLHQLNRPGLLLLNGVIYIAYASHCDFGPYHGWLLAYDTAAFSQKAALNFTPNGGDGGIWMSGAGLAADSSGSIFLATGNGTFDNAGINLGDSIVKIALQNGVLTVLDYFTPFNQGTLNGNDADLGSGGVLLLPDQSGSHPHLMIQGGKEGKVYLLDRDQLTTGNVHYCAGNCNSRDVEIVQEIPSASAGIFSTPAYFDGSVYFWGRNDKLKAFVLNGGILGTAPTVSASSYGFPGATPSISANGITNGIVWSIDSSQYGAPGPGPGPAVVHAHDASNVAQELWNSTQAAKNRDVAGNAVKFAVPTVANGKVYVGTSTELDVYGLFVATLPQAVTPAISPTSGSFTSSIAVTLVDSTPGSSIFYTTDNSTPTSASTQYTGSFTLTLSATVNAMATASGFTPSGLATASYAITQVQAASPQISPASGTYTGSVSVTITDLTSGAGIFYTTDGSMPNASSTQYTGAFNLTASASVTAVAIVPGFAGSAASSANYIIPASGPVVNFGAGFTASGLALNGGAAINGTRLRLTDTGNQEARSAFFSTPVNIQSFTNDFSFQLTSAKADGVTFTIQGNSPAALGPAGGGLGYGPPTPAGAPGIPRSVAVKFDLYNNAGEGGDSIGMYTNGASPSTPFTDLTPSGVNLHSGDVFNVHMTYDGTTLAWTITDASTGKTFSTSAAVNIPTIVGGNTAFVGFTGATGGLTAIQEIVTWTFSTAPGTAANTPIQFETESLPGTSSGPTYRVFTWPGFTDGAGTILDAANVGDSVIININVPTAGIYDVKYAAKKFGTRGISQLSVNGANVGGVVDQYSPVTGWQEFDLGTVNFAAGNQPFAFTLFGKSAASSGFTISFDYIKLTPQ